MRIVLGTLLVVALTVAIGCEGDVSSGPETAAGGGEAPAPPPPAPPGDPNQEPPADEANAAANAPPAAKVVPEPAAPANSEPGTLEVATAKSGAKGRDYGGPGFITTPIQQYFRAGSRINLLHMANTLKIYKAGHDNKGPKTHEEFMNVIVKENGIQLPELPAGEEYVYDPKTEELMVRHPDK